VTTAQPLSRWSRFWFTPVDPTTLGFMRVVTGLLILYIHAAYSLDLQAFFGKTGWYGAAEVDRERKEFPILLPPLTGEDAWKDWVDAPHVPLFPHRRQAVMEFVRAGLPGDKAGRTAALAYLARLQRTQNPATVRDGLLYLRGLPEDSKARAAHLDAMVNKGQRTAVDQVPTFLDALPQDGADGRATVKAEIERLYAALPKDSDRRRFTLDFFLEQDISGRQQFLDFLDRLPDDPEARAKKIDYLEFWNNEAEKAYAVGTPIFSLWFHITDPGAMAAAHAGVLFVMLLFTLGVCTRVTSVLTWLAAVSYIHRTQQILFGMDTMMNLLLIYLMIGDSGQALSVDRLIRRYRVARQSLRRSGTLDAATRAYLAAPPPSVTAGFATRMVQIHFCFIYMAAGMSKLKGPAWWSHMAFWDTMINPEFTWVHFPWYESFLRWAMSERWAYGVAGAVGVAFTFVMELGLPFLVWTRMRPVAVIGAFLLHFGIAVFMGLILFGLLMMTLLLAYIPGAVIREQVGGAAAGRMTFRYDGRSARQRRAAALVAMLDTDSAVEVLDTAAGGVRLTADGKEVTGPAAGDLLFARLGVTRKVWMLRYVPVVGGRLAGLLAPTDAAPPPPPATPDSAGKAVAAA
jgi:hypothetical protein